MYTRRKQPRGKLPRRKQPPRKVKSPAKFVPIKRILSNSVSSSSSSTHSTQVKMRTKKFRRTGKAPCLEDSRSLDILVQVAAAETAGPHFGGAERVEPQLRIEEPARNNQVRKHVWRPDEERMLKTFMDTPDQVRMFKESPKVCGAFIAESINAAFRDKTKDYVDLDYIKIISKVAYLNKLLKAQSTSGATSQSGGIQASHESRAASIVRNAFARMAGRETASNAQSQPMQLHMNVSKEVSDVLTHVTKHIDGIDNQTLLKYSMRLHRNPHALSVIWAKESVDEMMQVIDILQD